MQQWLYSNLIMVISNCSTAFFMGVHLVHSLLETRMVSKRSAGTLDALQRLAV
jgi:hypothetical protein